ncbi:MmcQ/YjbR family DNA-binding protein [Aurantibacillus circumpalustris]|uniref:MmcQ/YjbR family DNA-binding protein n=1 Tax=Aurantibacillus circumpalustris TaxID=3036359 RepID=UPI00295BB79A|nr:MmcQ/YjbR family DNA-binding protein [Aurantibacillus circumpalustris]
MNAEEIRDYCFLKKGVEESFPFDDKTLVFKVGNKIFLLLSLDASPVQFNAKCDPNKAIELREKHSCIIPGYHMNKQHWNTLICDGSLPKTVVFNCIDDSYKLIVNSLPKKLRELNGL